MKEVKLQRSICTTYLAKLVNFVKRLPEEDERKYAGQGNYFKGVLWSLMAIISNSMNQEMMLKNMSKIKNILLISYPNKITLNSYISHLKSHVIHQFESCPEVVSLAKKTLCLSKEDYDELDKNYTKLVVDRNKNQETLSDVLVIKIVHEMTESLKWEEMMIAVALAVGSRMIEIAKVSTYQAVGGEPYKICITNVAKKKGKPTTIIKPIVCGLRSIQISSLVQRIRRLLWTEWSSAEASEEFPNFDAVDNKYLTGYIASHVKKYVKQQLGVFVEGKLSFHTLRSIYAEMAWVESEGTHTMSKTAYYAEVLGHDPNDIKTALSYQRFVVKHGIEVKEVKKPVTYTDNVMKAKKKKNKKFANFKGKNGWFKIQKGTGSGPSRLKKMDEDSATLIENGLKATYENMRRCGYGSNLIKKWKLTQKSKELRQDVLK